MGVAWCLADETVPRMMRNLGLQQNDESGVVFEYVLPDIEEVSIFSEEHTFQLLRLDGFGSIEEEGAPQLPRARLVFGVPLAGDVHVSVVSTEITEREGYRIAPVPTLIRSDEEGSIIPVEKYIPDEDFYSTDGFYPQQIYEIEEPSFLRNQRIAALILRPIQFNPVTGELRIHTHVTVSLRFEDDRAAESRLRTLQDGHFESLYQRVLINYETAKQWRKLVTYPRAKGSSVLENQTWYKVRLQQDGIYRIDYDDLDEAGVDLGGVDPRTLRMFNGGGRELPRDLSESRPDSLTETAVTVVGEADGSFDREDYILFYGQGLSGWDYDSETDEYTYYFNHYTDDNIYWLTFDSGGQQGKRIPSTDGSLQSSNPVVVQSARDRVHEEREVTNPLYSGLTWYWSTTSGGETKVLRRETEDAIADSQATVTVRLKGKTDKELGTHEVKLYFNDHFIEQATFYNKWELLVEGGGVDWIVDGENELEVEHIRQSGSDIQDQIYIDWYEIRYRRRLVAVEDELTFLAPSGTETVEFRLTGFSGNEIQVYNITDPFNVVAIENPSVTEELRFQDLQDPTIERRYVALDIERVKSPLSIAKAEIRDLRSGINGADYLIIVHDDFSADVEPLRDHRQEYNGFTVDVVGTSAIYDEFSWGLFDPTAIRDFLAYTSESGHWSPQPAFVLFVGDGNYDYKNYSLTSPGNWIPPYELEGIAYDDWYVSLDGDNVPDMFLGRLPAQSRDEVQRMVEKIIRYDTEPTLGPWRNRILLLADDEIIGCRFTREDSWNTVHTQDSELLSQQSIPGNFEQIKIYLMEYDLDQSCRKPGATDDLIAALNDGVALFNYIGHGGYEVIADERAFYAPSDLPRVQNEGMPFLLAAFTCDMGVYDRPRDESIAEDMLRLENKGSIASIAASRGTYSDPNFNLSQWFYYNLFMSGAGFGIASTIGEALLAAKEMASSSSVSRLYLLFGDPAQRFNVPRYEAVIKHLEPDTLQALEVISLEGEIVQTDGTVLSDFHEYAQLDVYDSRKEVLHITPDGQKQVKYALSGAVLYRGVIPVQQGAFQTQFVIPKDITYEGHTGRISLYVSSDTDDAAGYRDSLVTAGGAVGIVDSIGPSIEMTIVDREESFIEGDYVQLGEMLKVMLTDSSGINITGETGHWIVLKVDGDSRTRINMTPYFVYDEGSYQSGRIEYELKDLTSGEHTLDVKAWDNHNNASAQSLSFRVAAAEDFQILNYWNYPNPFDQETVFTYELTGTANDVSIKIYTVSGRLIKTLRNLPGNLGFNYSTWEGLDEDGDRLANGVYLYKVIARGTEGQRKEQIGRLFVMR